MTMLSTITAMGSGDQLLTKPDCFRLCRLRWQPTQTQYVTSHRLGSVAPTRSGLVLLLEVFVLRPR